jgi:hypothetical protein
MQNERMHNATIQSAPDRVLKRIEIAFPYTTELVTYYFDRGFGDFDLGAGAVLCLVIFRFAQNDYVIWTRYLILVFLYAYINTKKCCTFFLWD